MKKKKRISWCIEFAPPRTPIDKWIFQTDIFGGKSKSDTIECNEFIYLFFHPPFFWLLNTFFFQKARPVFNGLVATKSLFFFFCLRNCLKICVWRLPVSDDWIQSAYAARKKKSLSSLLLLLLLLFLRGKKRCYDVMNEVCLPVDLLRFCCFLLMIIECKLLREESNQKKMPHKQGTTCR